ncbi:MAG: hypothetical protein B0A82_09200 [Alkalinema sp. CACIAM 70d]|nr:MAG: hypothetical protein B0A82_09200 [Alkalinema sp. CACIAM 70d]
MGKYALLIGVDTYGAGLQPLPAASKDVEALREVLLDPQMGGFDEVKPLINPTQLKMAKEIQLWFQDRQPEDLILLFFSGHGLKNNFLNLYFAATDTEKKLVEATATSAKFIHDCIQGCKSKHQVIILDCCFSGAFGNLVPKDDGEISLKEQLGAEGRVVLTSTNAVNFAFAPEQTNLSIYTQYLVEGIATGAADEDGDGFITVHELHCYAGRKVKEASPAMSPTLITLKDEGFQIRLAKSLQADPKLKYRKEAEKLATIAEFTIIAKAKLEWLRTELGLTNAEAEEIEAEVLKPFHEFQRKQGVYQKTLQNCLQENATLSFKVIEELVDFRQFLGLRPEDVAAIEQAALGGKTLADYSAALEQIEQGSGGEEDNSEEHSVKPRVHPPDVGRKDLSECNPSKILFIKNIRRDEGWAYTFDDIQQIGGSVERRVFELFWSLAGKGVKSASKGDLMLLNQQARITHVVEMLDDEVRKDEWGYFRWVRVVWMPEESDWYKLPHQRNVLGFEPPKIGGGTAYSLVNLGKFQETWSSLEDFQQHVFQILTGTKPPTPLPQPPKPEEVDASLSSERFGANYYVKLRDLLAAQNWRAADQETADRMCEVMNRQKQGYLEEEDIKKFPHLDLRNIDRLWVHYSQGKFGFSVQKKIWKSCSSPAKYNKYWEQFGDTVGWKDPKGWPGYTHWYNYRFYTFESKKAPVGHLPSPLLAGEEELGSGDFFGRGLGASKASTFLLMGCKPLLVSLFSRQDL